MCCLITPDFLISASVSEILQRYLSSSIIYLRTSPANLFIAFSSKFALPLISEKEGVLILN